MFLPLHLIIGHSNIKTYANRTQICYGMCRWRLHMQVSRLLRLKHIVKLKNITSRDSLHRNTVQIV